MLWRKRLAEEREGVVEKEIGGVRGCCGERGCLGGGVVEIEIDGVRGVLWRKRLAR